MARKKDRKLQDRAYIAMILTLVLGFGIGVFGMINTGLIHGEENRRKAESEQLSDTVVAARRGTIYDSNMNILAQSTDAWKIFVNPKEIPDEATAKRAASSLSSILELDYDDVLADCLKKERKYIVLKSKVDFKTKQLIEKLRDENKGYNRFLGIEDDVTRFYPYDNFASTVIGFTGSSDKGMSGLESAYNTKLTGLTGRNITAQNAKQRQISSDFATYYAAQEGASLQLTIDNAIQYYLDSALSHAVETQDATYGYGIVMDVKTGAILAMSSQPDYDLNDPYGSYYYSEFEWNVYNGIITIRYADTGYAPVHIYDYELSSTWFEGYFDDGTYNDTYFRLRAINNFDWDPYWYDYDDYYYYYEGRAAGNSKQKSAAKGAFAK